MFDPFKYLHQYSIYSFAIVLLCAITVYFFVRAYYKTKTKRDAVCHYLDIIRTVSRAICDKHEIITFDSSENVVYTTHPHTYRSKKEFLQVLRSKVNASLKFQHLCNIIDRRVRGNELLSGSGSGLMDDYKKWMITGRPVNKLDSLINEDLYIVTICDITKHIENYEKIEKSRQRLEAFLDTFPFGIFYVNNSGIIVGANSTFASLVTIDRNKLIGLSITDFVENFNYNLTQQRPTFVSVKPKFSSAFKGILIKSSPSASTSGQPWILCRIDQRSDNGNDYNFCDQESFIFAAVPSAITTMQGEIIDVNPSFSSLVQDKIIVDKHKTIKSGSNLIDCISENKEAFVQHLKKLRDFNDALPPIEVKFTTSSIVTMAYVSKLSIQKTIKKNSQLLLMQFVDISDQKKLEQQFIQSQKMQAIGQLAGGIAHDFNNLLTAMIGFCDLLLQRYTPKDPSYGDVVQIKQNAGRAANLVRQLLAFAQQQTMKPQIISVTESLADLNFLLKRLIGIGIDFQITNSRDVWPIKVDHGQFEQVIINLAINARDALTNIHDAKLTIKTQNFSTLESFKCVFDTARPGDYVLVEVIDNGVGIESTIIENIFEPFFTRKKTKPGTGLGLSTVYGIVNQTGGFINVESTIGKGSSFQIYLPRHIGPEASLDKQTEQCIKDLSGTETILLVEDEDAVRIFSARALKDKGYKVIEASSGTEALEIVAGGQIFDLLITDVTMPHMDGPTLNEKLKEITQNFKTIFISGYAEDTFRKDLDKDLSIYFLQKPFSLKDLAIKVKEVILLT